MRIQASGATLGATVTDVRLHSIDGGDWKQIEDAFHAFAVLVFPGANLDEEEHLAFSRRSGHWNARFRSAPDGRKSRCSRTSPMAA